MRSRAESHSCTVSCPLRAGIRLRAMSEPLTTRSTGDVEVRLVELSPRAYRARPDERPGHKLRGPLTALPYTEGSADRDDSPGNALGVEHRR